MTDFYQHIEIFNPLINLFFPELSGGKIYRVMIITDLQQFDVPLLVQADDVCLMFKDAIKEELNVDVEIKTTYNERYFPKEEGVEYDDGDSLMMGNTLVFKTRDEFNASDFIVSESFVVAGKEEIATVSTITVEPPTPLTQQFTLH